MKTGVPHFSGFFCLFSSVLALLARATKGHAREASPEGVYIQVEAPETIEKLVKSRLLKRLRGSQNVKIATTIDNAENGIFVGAIALRLQSGQQDGYCFSVIYASKVPFLAVRDLARGYLDEKVLGMITDEIRGQACLRRQMMYVCSIGGLNGTIDEIVADINVEILEPDRQIKKNASKEFKAEAARRWNLALLPDRLTPKPRKAVGATLTVVGLLTTIPLVWAVFGRCERVR
jgi:hypothetical protein